MKIGNRIQQARVRAGMSQRELAAAVGVSFGLVGQWESHVKAPGRENLKRIAEVTLTSPAELLGMEAADTGVPVSKDEELDLLRRYRRLSVRQRQNLRELLGMAGNVRREIEQESEPAES